MLSDHWKGCHKGLFREVLILVVMEDALWQTVFKIMARRMLVLILVVMEDALWLYGRVSRQRCWISLNPCCNGRCSLTLGWNDQGETWIFVLILVVMEDALWLFQNGIFWVIGCSLNPCCNGRCSLTNLFIPKQLRLGVLILVVMEDALWHFYFTPKTQTKCVLILVVMEDALWPWRKSWNRW